MMLSVVALRVISTAVGDESAGVDGYGCPEFVNDAGPVDPFASPRDSAEVVLNAGWKSGSGSGSSKCFAYSEGEYSSTWSSWGVRAGPNDCRFPRVAPADGCQCETGSC